MTASRSFARWRCVSLQQQQVQQYGPGATQGSPVVIKVTANYQANVRDTNIDVAVAGVTVTLPVNPTLGTTIIEFAAEQAFNLSGGVNPFTVDPQAIPAGAQFFAAFTGAGWLLSPNPGPGSTPTLFGALATTPGPKSGRGVISLDGYNASGDGGGGVFTFKSVLPPGFTVDTGTAVAAPGGGFWIRLDALLANSFRPEWWGGKPNANFQSQANGKWYVDSGFVTEAADDAVKFRNARDLAVAVTAVQGGFATVFVDSANWYFKTADPNGPDNEFCLMKSNVHFVGRGETSVIRIPGGTTTGATGYAAIFGRDAFDTTETYRVNNVRISGFQFDHNSKFNQWAGPLFNGLGHQAHTNSVSFPRFSNVIIEDCLTINHNGVFQYSLGNYQFNTSQYCDDFQVRRIKLRNCGDDPNLGDCSWIAGGAQNGKIEDISIEVAVTSTIIGITSGTGGVIRLQTATAHQFRFDTGGPPRFVNLAIVQGVLGLAAANGQFSIHVVDATHIELLGTVFAAGYTGGGTIDACRGSTGIEFHGIEVDIVQYKGRGMSVGGIAAADSASSGPVRWKDCILDQVVIGIDAAATAGNTNTGPHCDGCIAYLRTDPAGVGENGFVFGATTPSIITDAKMFRNKVYMKYGTGSATQGSGFFLPSNVTRLLVQGNESYLMGRSGILQIQANVNDLWTDVQILDNVSHNPRVYGVETGDLSPTNPSAIRRIVDGNVTIGNGLTTKASVSLGQYADTASYTGHNPGSNLLTLFNPSTLANLAYWIEAPFGLTPGALQLSWPDQSTNGITFTQPAATAPNTPIYESTFQEVLFNGSQVLSLAQTTTMPFTGAFTICGQFRLSAVPGAGTVQVVFVFFIGGGVFVQMTVSNLGGWQNISFSAGISSVASASVGVNVTLDTNMHTFQLTYNNGGATVPGNYTFAWDGHQQTVVASASTSRPANDLSAIGARVANGPVISAGISGAIRKLFGYTRVLSTAGSPSERDKAQLYLIGAAP